MRVFTIGVLVIATGWSAPAAHAIATVPQGYRVCLEHGPRGGCVRWSRPHYHDVIHRPRPPLPPVRPQPFGQPE